MDLETSIQKIKKHSYLLNCVLKQYEEEPSFFDEEEKLESIRLLTTILNKVDEDYSVSMILIKNNLLFKNENCDKIELSDGNESDDTDDSITSNCSVGSDNFLYGLNDSDCNENCSDIENDSEDESDGIHPELCFEDISQKIKENNELPSKSNDNVSVKEKKDELKESFLEENIKYDKIILYKTKNKIERLNNYIESSYSY